MSLPSYTRFFDALTGFSPRAYQEELARRLQTGEMPDLIDAPTGTGKTSAAFAAWLYSVVTETLAARQEDRPRRVPLRLYYTVDRRVVVDGAYETVLTIIERITTSDDEAIIVFRELMRDLFDIGPDDDLIQVCRLRGGLEHSQSADYLRDPHRPAIILTTVDMGLSRLLFRGYQLSPRRRSIEAGLAAIDCLWVVDEPQLVGQGLTTLKVLSDREIATEDRFGGHVPPLRVISMSATSHVPGDSPVSWDQDEEEQRDPALAHRRCQREAVPVVVEQTADKPLDALTAASKELVGSMQDGESAVVFCTTVVTARSVHARLASVCRKAGVKTYLLTGGMPGRLSTQIVRDLAPVHTGAQRDPHAAPILVIATSTLEVGADLDFDHLVTQTAEAGSLIQRLGRVNRVGAREKGSVRVIHSTFRVDPIHGEAATRVAELLEGAQTLGEVQRRLRETDEPQLLRRAQQVPILLPPSVLRAYTRTAGSPHDTPVAPFIRSLDDPVAECHLVVRQGVELMSTVNGSALVEDFQDTPPHLPTEAWSIKMADLSKVVGQLVNNSPLVLLDPAQTSPPELIYSTAQLSQVRPGDVLVVAPQGVDKALGVPGAGVDLSDRRVIPGATLRDIDKTWKRWDSEGQDCPPVILTDLAGHVCPPGTQPADHLRELTEEIAIPKGWVLDYEVLGEELAHPWLRLCLVRPAQALEMRTVSLNEHQGAVAELAARWARGIGLPEQVAWDLGVAGAWHDAERLSHTCRRL